MIPFPIPLLIYTAGYVIHETKQKLSKKPNGSDDKPALARELNLCLIELSNDFDECKEPSAPNWTGEINRGELYLVNSPTYQPIWKWQSDKNSLYRLHQRSSKVSIVRLLRKYVNMKT